MSKFIDLTGQTFGVLTVLEKDIKTSKEKGRIYWKCKCNKCNNEVTVRTDSLKGLPKCCINCKYPNLIGQRFGKLTVISKGKKDKNGHIYWYCECDCGNIKEIAGSNLIEGKTTSCGCEHSRICSELHSEDLMGQKFGKLTVLQKASSIGEKTKWLCKCDCGTEVVVQTSNLKDGHTISCGCVKSKGELTIRQILLNNNILFKTEFSFSDFPRRRFDFAILNNNQIQYLIEYDGKQHFSYSGTWHKTLEEFQNSIKRDIEKDQYCKDNNIPLIRIPYTHLNDLKIEDLLLETSEYIVK